MFGKSTNNKDLYIPSSIIQEAVKQWLIYLEDNGFITSSDIIYNNKTVMDKLTKYICSSETKEHQIQDFTNFNFVKCPFNIGKVRIENERDLQIYINTIDQLTGYKNI